MDGTTGDEEIVAVIDTGIFQSNSEFSGRISSDSTDIFTSRGTIEAEGDHGTLVAIVAAGANNNIGTVGIAYDATILSIRADTPGSCADGHCKFGDISDAIDWAVDHGATVINLSMGGSGASFSERAAVRRAAEAGVIVVVSAGNDSQSEPDPFASGLAGLDTGNVIIVGAVDFTGTMADFSNGAQGREQYYLAALGQAVAIGDSDGTYNYKGTSFSAPQVAGAVALIAQAFPTLTGAQIVELLLSTAQDVGVVGVDNVYGNGILDIHEAFQPQGTLSVAGKSTQGFAETDVSVVGSSAMGDALGTKSVNTIILDKYERAFNYNLGVRMRSAPVSNVLQGAVGQLNRTVAQSSDKAAVSFTIDASQKMGGYSNVYEMRLREEEADAARLLAARIALKISPSTQLGFAYADGANGLVMQLQGQDRPAFLIAGSALGDAGFFSRQGMSVAMRRQLGDWGLTLSAQSLQSTSSDLTRYSSLAPNQYGYDRVWTFGLAADRQWTNAEAAIALNWMKEDRTVLGARFNGLFGGGGANTLFVDATAGWDFAPKWRVTGAVRNGVTQADTSAVVETGSYLYSSAWSVDLEKRGFFGSQDRLGFRIGQPLRVEGGGMKLNLPVTYSYDTRTAEYARRTISLTPQGREVMSELAWHGSFLSGDTSASLYYRKDPGHYKDVPDDAGVAIRWRKGF